MKKAILVFTFLLLCINVYPWGTLKLHLWNGFPTNDPTLTAKGIGGLSSITVQATSTASAGWLYFEEGWSNKWGATATVNTVGTMNYKGADGSINVTNGLYYTFNFPSNPNADNTNKYCILVTSALPVVITSVSDNFSGSGVAVVINITLNGSKSPEEKVFVRYTTDGWSTSSFVEASGTGTSYSATIPASGVIGTSSNYYYVLTTTVGEPNHIDADLLTLNYSNNSGLNYPLPVELSSFTANIIGNEINLNWKTATEVNNYGFNVERASTSLGIEWEKIGFVNGSGNSNSPKEYSYKDKTAAAGNYTYRLKQIDNDGQFKYSPEVEVSVNSIVNGYTLEQNYPNPFNPTTSIKFGFNNDTEVNLLVFDQIGNQVATLYKGKADAGRIYNAEFNAEGLSSGIYFYRLETPLKSEVRKMLLIK